MTYKVTETVTMEKIVEARDETEARSKAYEQLPDYETAGWELINSEGPYIEEDK